MSNWFGNFRFVASKNPHDWLYSAEFDLERAGRMYGAEDYIGAAYFAYTAIEKAMKGFLHYNNETGRQTRIHNLNTLWKACGKYDRDFIREDFKMGISTGVYLETKYPHADSSTYEKYDNEDVMAFMRFAAELCGFIAGKVSYD